MSRPPERTVALRDWDLAVRRWRLDVAGGTLAPDGEEPARGFAAVNGASGAKRDWEFAAAYADAGSLWLQSGRERWPLAAVEVDHEETGQGVECLATVRTGGRIVRTFTYPNPREDPVALLDPTFDETDAELADFFLWLSRRLRHPGWTDDVLDIWAAGLR